MEFEALRFPQEKRHFDRTLSFFDPNVVRIVRSAIGREYDEWRAVVESGRGGLSRPGRADAVVAAVFDRAVTAMGIGRPVSLFLAECEPRIARSMLSFAEGERGAIIVSRELGGELSEGELSFAVAHELGHLALGHGLLRGLIEAVYGDGKGMPPLIHREYGIWSTLAECSCDRIGAELAGGTAIAASALARLESRDRDGLPIRLRALEGADGFDRAYRELLEGGSPAYCDAYRDFLLAAGMVVARGDGAASAAELAYIANRLSRVMYVGPEEEAGILSLRSSAEAALAASAREFRASFPGGAEEAFLDLTVLALRDGRLSEHEYESLRRIGADALGLSDSSMDELCMRVIRSSYYRPYSEA